MISLQINGTHFRLVSRTNDSLLNTNYTTTTSNGIQKLIQFTFLYFFPEYKSYVLPLQNYTSEISVIKKKYEKTEIITVYYGGEIILQSADISGLNRLPSTNGTEVVCGRLTNIKVVAAEDLDVKKLDNYNFTALHWAALLGEYGLGQKLIEKGADVNAIGSMGLTALHWASATGHDEFCKLLVDNGADVNYGHQGGTPIHAASEMGRTAVVRVLAEKCADINAKHAKDGRTPLLKAVWNGHFETVKELTSLGADINSRSRVGSTALHEAAERGHGDIVKHLLDLGMDINIRDGEGRTPLIVAADRTKGYGNNIDILDLLIRSGADPNINDFRGQTALSVSKHFDTVQNFLRSHGATDR